MVKKLKKTLDNSEGQTAYWFIKSIYCLRHDLLIAKPAAYGFDQPSLCFIFSHLSDSTPRTKINNAYSSYTDIKYGAPQSFISDALLFDIDICDFFIGL